MLTQKRGSISDRDPKSTGAVIHCMGGICTERAHPSCAINCNRWFVKVPPLILHPQFSPLSSISIVFALPFQNLFSGQHSDLVRDGANDTRPFRIMICQRHAPRNEGQENALRLKISRLMGTERHEVNHLEQIVEKARSNHRTSRSEHFHNAMMYSSSEEEFEVKEAMQAASDNESDPTGDSPILSNRQLFAKLQSRKRKNRIKKTVKQTVKKTAPFKSPDKGASSSDDYQTSESSGSDDSSDSSQSKSDSTHSHEESSDDDLLPPVIKKISSNQLPIAATTVASTTPSTSTLQASGLDKLSSGVFVLPPSRFSESISQFNSSVDFDHRIVKKRDCFPDGFTCSYPGEKASQVDLRQQAFQFASLQLENSLKAQLHDSHTAVFGEISAFALSHSCRLVSAQTTHSKLLPQAAGVSQPLSNQVPAALRAASSAFELPVAAVMSGVNMADQALIFRQLATRLASTFEGSEAPSVPIFAFVNDKNSSSLKSSLCSVVLQWMDSCASQQLVCCIL
jgi:hypothetical protein